MEKQFESKLNNIFDIAHNDALSLTTNEESKQFLILQRKGRIGSLGSVDRKLTQKEELKRKQATKIEDQRNRQKNAIAELLGT